MQASARDLVGYSVRLGMRGVVRRGGPEAKWRIWMPLDADRVVELPWVAARVSELQAQRVLDVASPKLLACWLAERTTSEVTAIDLWGAEIERWQKLVAAADPARRRFGRLTLEAGDGTSLPYSDASFDAALSVSVLEHI